MVERARRARPDAVFGADLIAGFPTETEAMFEETLAAIGELGLAHIHVFPYSTRPGTPAARMAQVPARLRAEGEKGLRRFLESRAGTMAQVLVEREGQGLSRGLSQHYAAVRLDFGAPPGAIVDARVTGVGDGYLLASQAA